ncbi:ubiquitin carboxyl-terminal hydrolase 20-like [Humulus lupulus]|uniref:ubiquitin carboxyl-terminal hydrolase 20-like n=1 Tax=Humulus lupulus TaxID=3486 RepID=UPI002B417E7E|nr:ubiquitin carboxyl-terminal hydrolase 20-like [Humulus lupulus]
MDPKPPNPISFNSSDEEFPHRSQPSSPQSDAMPRQDFQTRSSFDSELAAIDDLSLAPSDSPIQTLASGQSSIPIEPEPISAVDGESSSLVPSLKQGLNGDNLSFARVEEKEAQREEDSPTSPSYCVEGGLSNYDPNPHWSPFADISFYIHEARPSMVGAGLINLGNTCFINAVLQCFTHTVPLVKGLRSCKHDMLCRSGCREFCVICSMYDHIQLSIESSGGCISPLKFVDNLNHFSTSFMRYQQEDAHEFLQCFLDKLERCFLNFNKEEKTTPPIENLVQKVFGGRLISRLQCCHCGHCSDTFEPLIDLSLEIENVESLPSALQSFTSEEKIGDSDTKFTCENCKEKVAVVKQLMVDQAPSVAVFHLKRFKNDGSYVEKIDKHVKFPLELDLQSYTTSASSDDVELIYDLYAIVVHVGLSSMFGHYFSFVRSSPDTWHRLDDSKVTRVEEEFVLSQDAYILFYARRGTPWFSSLVGAEMKSLDPAILSTSPQSVLDAVENTCPLPNSAYINDASVAPDVVSCLPKLSCVNQNFITTPIGKNDCPGVESSKAEASGVNCITTPIRENDCQGVESSKVKASDLNCNATPFRENDFHGVESSEVKIGGDDVFHPLTPPRSQSPELFSFETPASSFQIPRDHLKSEERATTRKRLSNKVPDDSKTKEAIRYLSKSMPSSRGSKLLDAMCRPQSAGASRKKKRLVSPCKRAGPANARHKSSHGSVVHPVAAVLR